MDMDPLLPTHLNPLPEHSPVSTFSAPPSPASYKERIIFGAHPPPPPPPPPPPRYGHHRRISVDGNDFDLPSFSSSPPTPPSDPEDPSSASAAGGGGAPSLFDFLAGAAGARTNLHRSRTAPAMAPLSAAALAAFGDQPPGPPRRRSIVLHAFLFLLAYLALGVTFYAAAPANFASSAGPTHPVADALYFCIVTLCTIGYGDITPATPAAKLFSISFVLVGFGFVDILLSGMVSYVLDLQEHLLITALKNPRSMRKHRHNYIFDIKKGRMSA